MEIKLTTDWIILQNSEVFIDAEGIGMFRVFGDGFHYNMFELALKTLEVEYTCDESYDDDDDELKNPTYYFTFKNIEDIKFKSPELYAEYKRMLEVKAKERKEWKQKEEVILEFLESPKTKNQIKNMIEKKFYPKKDQNASSKYYIEGHVGCIIDSLYENDLIRYEKNKIVKV